MFTPQMLNAIRIVKIVITALTPLIKTKDIGTNKVIVMAVIKGDVHDVDKDIISTVLSCNGYRIIDLGTPVPANKIVQAAIKYEANAIWISGQTFISVGWNGESGKTSTKWVIGCPLLVGDEPTGELHTVIKLYPEYPNGNVIYIKDVSMTVDVLVKLFKGSKYAYVKSLKSDYELIIENYNTSASQRCDQSW